MARAGAALLDVGAMSTAPYLDGRDLRGAEEADRLGWAVGLLAGKLDVPVSADTSRVGPARAALEAGARIINDVTRPDRRSRLWRGWSPRPGPASSLMASDAAAAPPPGEPVATVRGPVARASACEPRRAPAGIPDERIVVDPGHRLLPAARHAPGTSGTAAVLAGLGRAARARPAALRRRLAQVLHRRHGRRAPIPPDRLPGSLAAAAAAVLGGAHVDPRPRRGRDRPGRAGGARPSAARGEQAVSPMWPALQAFRLARRDRHPAGGDRALPRLRHVQGDARGPDAARAWAALMVASFLARRFELFSTSWILDNFWSFWVLALIVLFQPELRRAPRPARRRARLFQGMTAGAARAAGPPDRRGGQGGRVAGRQAHRRPHRPRAQRPGCATTPSSACRSTPSSRPISS